MAIKRLPPDTDDFVIPNFTINKNLLPYFTKWYQDNKLVGETPEQFAIRQLTIKALNDYGNVDVQKDVEASKAAGKQAEQDGLAAIKVDFNDLVSETS